jgi:ABC-type multidrug transport system ATPase subunit
MRSAIEAESLVKVFGEVRALDGIDLVAREATVFDLLGPNGAGKTTAIRVLSTLLRPDAGRVSVGGRDVVRDPQEVRRLIGLTGQYAAVDELLSGQENLYMIGRLTGLSPAGSRKRASGSMSFVAPVRPPDDRADERRQGVCVHPREGIDGAHRVEKGSDR